MNDEGFHFRDVYGSSRTHHNMSTKMILSRACHLQVIGNNHVAKQEIRKRLMTYIRIGDLICFKLGSTFNIL